MWHFVKVLNLGGHPCHSKFLKTLIFHQSHQLTRQTSSLRIPGDPHFKYAHAGNRQQGLTWRPTKAHLKACQALLECQISLTCDFIRPYQDCLISLTCLSSRPHMNCQISLTCLSFRPHMNCQIRLTYFSFRPYLKVGQASPESRSVQNNLAFYPPSFHKIQFKNNLHSKEKNGRKSPTLSRWNYFTKRNAVSKYFLMQYSLLSFLIRRCSAPPFCFLRMSRPFTLLHSHPSALPQFFTFLSPFSDSLFTCLRNRIPLSVFMLSCSRKVSKQCVWKHKNIHI